MKYRIGVIKFHNKRRDTIQSICDKHGLTKLVDYGLNHFIYDELNIDNIIGIELDEFRLTYNDIYITIHNDYNIEVFNHISDNTLYTYFCFNENDCIKFKETLSKLQTYNTNNSYMLLWKRFRHTQEYELIEL